MPKKVLMMMKAAKLGLAGPGAVQEHGRSKPEESMSRAEAGVGQEPGKSRAGTGLEQS